MDRPRRSGYHHLHLDGFCCDWSGIGQDDADPFRYGVLSNAGSRLGGCTLDFFLVRKMQPGTYSLGGLSPLPLRQTLVLGVFGGLLVGGASLLKAFEGGSVWIGDLLFVCASSSWAMYSVLARKYKVDAVQATIAFTVFAGLCYLPLYGVLAATNNLPFGLVSHLADAPHSEIAFQMLMQGIGSGIVGNIGFTLMLKHFGPVRSTMMTALVPSLASLSAVFFLGEPLYWNLVAGLLLALIVVVIGVMSASKNTVRPELVDGHSPQGLRQAQPER